jgi:putative transcriptional regulator of dUTPase subunit (tetR/acrR family); similar to E.coli ttk
MTDPANPFLSASSHAGQPAVAGAVAGVPGAVVAPASFPAQGAVAQGVAAQEAVAQGPVAQDATAQGAVAQGQAAQGTAAAGTAVPETAASGAAASGAAASGAAASGAAASGAAAPEAGAERPRRKRPKPGERRLQILQALAGMLEQPQGERVTTAALAARLQVSEAALYRHFASKAQMFEGLIEFIESTLFGLINQITRDEEDALSQIQQILNLLLTFSERNPGMTRVLVGDALINEDDRLQVRINQLLDRLELSLKQCFRTAMVQEHLPPDTDAGARADLLLSYVLGRWIRYAKGGFRRMPTENAAIQIGFFVG